MRIGIALAAAAACLATSAARADLIGDGKNWDVATVPNEAASRFTYPAPGEVDVESDGSVAFLYREVDPPTSGGVAWNWRVDRSAGNADQFAKGADDRAIAVHLWFFREGTGADTLFGGVAEFLGYPRISHALTYVWGGADRPEGPQANPYFDSGRIVVLRTEDMPKGEWLPERRDLARDVRAAFGDAVSLQDLKFVAISSDTDNQGGLARARIKDLEWTPRP